MKKDERGVAMKPLPIGRDNFKQIIENNCYYVDKTKLIEDLLITGAYVTLFPRPRRFGKSLMLSTIDEFFNVEKNKIMKIYLMDCILEKASMYQNKENILL